MKLFGAVKKSLMGLSLVCAVELGAERLPVAIMGGQGPAPYAALLYDDASLFPLSLPATGLTFRVAMNKLGTGLVVGTDGINAYAAYTTPEGALTQISGLIAPGEIYTAAINESGKSILGGGRASLNIPYAAFANRSGSITPIVGLPANGLIYGVAIDSRGEAIMGGKGPGTAAYAALVSASGSVSPIVGLPSNGSIFWVTVNNNQTRFIGGQDNASVYAAFITPAGTLSPIAGLPLGLNYSVGLNQNGSAIMGGTSLTLPYAALVSPTGHVTNLVDLPITPGIIYNVAINESGAGLIGGFANNTPYSSFVNPDGTLTPLNNLPTGAGFVDGLALHDAGVGIIGGTSQGSRFLALAAPDGTLTYLNVLPAAGEINSIALRALDDLVPKRLGQFESEINTQYAMSDVLTQHCMIHHRNGGHLSCLDSSFGYCCDETSLWFAPFGQNLNEKARHSLPGFTNKIVGAILGMDYRVLPDLTVGGAAAFAYNKVNYSKSFGHASINQESVVLYTTLNKSFFYMNAALWGGLYQSKYTRDSFLIIESKASPSGWNLSPHLEFSSPIPIPTCQGFVLDPFVAFDWANTWQNHYREHGEAGFNLRLHRQFASVMRSEIGLRLFETFSQSWGRVIVEEKFSFVNRAPLSKNKCSASFIGSISSFEVETLNSASQNIGKCQLHVELLPDRSNLYGSLDYQGGFGASFHAHMLTLTVGWNF